MEDSTVVRDILIVAERARSSGRSELDVGEAVLTQLLDFIRAYEKELTLGCEASFDDANWTTLSSIEARPVWSEVRNHAIFD